MSKAVYTASKNNPAGRDVAGALDYLNDILENAPYDEIMPHVLRLKAKYLTMSARYDEAREVLEQVIVLIPPHPTPEFKQCLDMAQGMEQSIAKMEEYKRMDDEYKAMKERRRVEKQNRINQQSN
jgi:tetratricopeptide (TPR) repeat protein